MSAGAKIKYKSTTFHRRTPLKKTQKRMKEREKRLASRNGNYRNPCVTMNQPWASLLVYESIASKVDLGLHPLEANDPNMKSSQALTNFLPLMIGYFALCVPSGLSLYWSTNNILSTTQQVWLQKLGGAKNPVRQISDNPVKEVQQKLEISGTDVNFTKVTPSRKEEKSSSGGPLPCER